MNKSIEWHQGVIFRIGRQVNRPQTHHIRGHASSSRQHHLLIDPADAEETDKNLILRVIEIVDHPSHRITFESCPLFPIFQN